MFFKRCIGVTILTRKGKIMKKICLLALGTLLLTSCDITIRPLTSSDSSSASSEGSSVFVSSTPSENESSDSITVSTSSTKPSTSSSSKPSTSSSSSKPSVSSSASSSSVSSKPSSSQSSSESLEIVINEDAGNYYNSINFDQSPTSLKTSLSKLIKNHDSLSYNELWDAFKTTDRKSDGTVWDMYSNEKFKFGSDQCGNYSKEGDCYNREHSVPKSWFDDKAPMYTDLFHLVPTDGYVNNRRSNYPFGEVSSATYTSKNGSKLGRSALSSYSGTVFEPIDEYKGDFARIYMYFVTCYQDKNITVTSEAKSTFVKSGQYYTLTDYAKELFLSWNELDPVSEKEIERNQNVYRLQGNRNPFVDIPALAEIIFND